MRMISLNFKLMYLLPKCINQVKIVIIKFSMSKKYYPGASEKTSRTDRSQFMFDFGTIILIKIGFEFGPK